MKQNVNFPLTDARRNGNAENSSEKLWQFIVIKSELLEKYFSNLNETNHDEMGLS